MDFHFYNISQNLYSSSANVYMVVIHDSVVMTDDMVRPKVTFFKNND